jgi:hypothetical protein
VEATSDWIWEIDNEGFYVYASPKIKDLLGYEPEEVIGKTYSDLMPKDKAERIIPLFMKILESRRPFSGLENTITRKNGQEITLETSGVPVIDGQGNFLGYRGFVRDISERKTTEEALRISQLRLSEAMELAHVVYWEDDLVKNLFVFNDAFYVFHGTTAAQEGGCLMTREEYAKRFIYSDDQSRMSQVVLQGSTKDNVEFAADFEHRIVRRDGGVRHVLTRTRIVRDSSGYPVRVYGTNQDITERKLVEEERERLIIELREALSHVKMLSGLLPVCSSCKKIRNDQGNWEVMELYIRDRSEADFSHGICPECTQRLYPEISKKEMNEF